MKLPWNQNKSFTRKDCEFQEACNCKRKIEQSCELCTFFRAIDSGYGWCIALPRPFVVAWCKEVCFFFGKKL